MSTDTDDLEEAAPPPPPPPTMAPGMRLRPIGMPVEKAANVRQSIRRLMSRLREHRLGVIAVLGLALASVTLSVLGPMILGHAFPPVVEAIQQAAAKGASFGASIAAEADLAELVTLPLRRPCVPSGLPVGRDRAAHHFHLREEVEAKLNRLPLKYVDSQQRAIY
jgi:hypothetical protein